MTSRLICDASFLFRRLTAALLIVGVCLSGVVLAQGGKKKGPPEPEKFSGKVKEIEKKGKAVTLTIEKEGGDTQDVLVTPKLKLLVQGKGDPAFLKAKTFVSSDQLVMANMELFGKKFTVYHGQSPQPGLKRDPNSAEVYQIAGQIVSADEKGFMVNCGLGAPRKVAFEENAPLEVDVQSQDPDLIVEGSEVEVEGMMRGTKFLPSKVTVTLENPITAEDLAASQDKKPGKKAPATAKSAKKGSKGKTEDAEDEGTGETADPFGVLGKKGGKDTPPKKKPADGE